MSESAPPILLSMSHNPLPKLVFNPDNSCKFSDQSNANIQAFFCSMLLDSRSDQKHFKNALDSLSKKVNQGTLTWCSEQTVPNFGIQYSNDILRTAFVEQTVSAQLSEKPFLDYIGENEKFIVLLTLLGRSLIGEQIQNSKNYCHGLDNFNVYRVLSKVMGFTLQNQTHMFRFTNSLCSFTIQKDNTFCLGNRSQIVEVVRFRQRPSEKQLKKKEKESEQHNRIIVDQDGTQSIDLGNQIKQDLQPENLEITPNKKRSQTTLFEQSTKPKAKYSQQIQNTKNFQSKQKKKREGSSEKRKKYQYLKEPETNLIRNNDYLIRYKI